eukprot:1144170-Pelagomonas_calceolata.AAC.2
MDCLLIYFMKVDMLDWMASKVAHCYTNLQQFTQHYCTFCIGNVCRAKRPQMVVVRVWQVIWSRYAMQRENHDE